MQEFNRITPNFNGVLFLQLILSLGVSLPITAYFFHPYGLILQILLVANFVILSMIWIAVVLLTGFKSSTDYLGIRSRIQCNDSPPFCL